MAFPLFRGNTFVVWLSWPQFRTRTTTSQTVSFFLSSDPPKPFLPTTPSRPPAYLCAYVNSVRAFFFFLVSFCSFRVAPFCRSLWYVETSSSPKRTNPQPATLADPISQSSPRASSPTPAGAASGASINRAQSSSPPPPPGGARTQIRRRAAADQKEKAANTRPSSTRAAGAGGSSSTMLSE